jgi:hypothetical protein
VSKLRIACSPLTARIYVGKINKAGDGWLGKPEKLDVTGDACAAVAKHAIMNGGSTVVTANGVPRYEIIVKEIIV